MRGARTTAAAVMTVALTSVASTPATAASTYEITPVAASSTYSFEFDRIAELDGLLYFSASTGGGAQTLWRIDPAAGAAEPVAAAQTGIHGVITPTPAGGFVYFIAQPATGDARLWRYDPATDIATDFVPLASPSQQLVVLDGVPYVSNGIALYAYDPAVPAAPATLIGPGLCTDGTPWTGVSGLQMLGTGIALSGSCGPGGDGELFAYDPVTGLENLYDGATIPAGADLAGPYDMAEYGGETFFGAGSDPNDLRLYRLDRATGAIDAVDPSTTRPGRPFLFHGRVTWLAEDASAKTVVVQLAGATTSRLPVTAYSDLADPVETVVWGDRLLLNGFTTAGNGDQTVYAYDPDDGVFSRLTTSGDVVTAVFVAADGTGYVAAPVTTSDVVVSRVTGQRTTGSSSSPAVLPVTGGDAAPLVAALPAAAMVAVGALLAAAGRTRRRRSDVDSTA